MSRECPRRVALGPVNFPEEGNINGDDNMFGRTQQHRALREPLATSALRGVLVLLRNFTKLFRHHGQTQQSWSIQTSSPSSKAHHSRGLLESAEEVTLDVKGASAAAASETAKLLLHGRQVSSATRITETKVISSGTDTTIMITTVTNTTYEDVDESAKNEVQRAVARTPAESPKTTTSPTEAFTSPTEASSPPPTEAHLRPPLTSPTEAFTSPTEAFTSPTEVGEANIVAVPTPSPAVAMPAAAPTGPLADAPPIAAGDETAKAVHGFAVMMAPGSAPLADMREFCVEGAASKCGSISGVTEESLIQAAKEGKWPVGLFPTTRHAVEKEVNAGLGYADKKNGVFGVKESNELKLSFTVTSSRGYLLVCTVQCDKCPERYGSLHTDAQVTVDGTPATVSVFEDPCYKVTAGFSAGKHELGVRVTSAEKYIALSYFIWW
ncbi:hypothetical protein CYMTET_23562 [Cymbomonas tetramitiformis]|uniref:Uncharacterized protein n=1 Tax=Cymbomonas tetramitiformis TaxID=36881 RepID=A0AAE0FXQ4_9CHLO|nr:hypothetical protein CYMTET_23562 [Cymbomonas tetramitiformis]